MQLLLLPEAHSCLCPSPPGDQRAAGRCPAHDAQLPALLWVLQCHQGCLKGQQTGSTQGAGAQAGAARPCKRDAVSSERTEEAAGTVSPGPVSSKMPFSPSWRELKETFEEELTSWWGRTILFKCLFWLIGLMHSWWMEEPGQFTGPVWITLFSGTHCWFPMCKDTVTELVTQDKAGHILKINPAAWRLSSCLGLLFHTQK